MKNRRNMHVCPRTFVPTLIHVVYIHTRGYSGTPTIRANINNGMTGLMPHGVCDVARSYLRLRYRAFLESTETPRRHSSSVFVWVKWEVVVDESLQGVCIKLDVASLSDG